MKDCLLVGVVCLVLGFFLHDLVYPKDKVENMSNKQVSTIIIVGIGVVGFLLFAGLISTYLSGKRSNKK